MIFGHFAVEIARRDYSNCFIFLTFRFWKSLLVSWFSIRLSVNIPSVNFLFFNFFLFFLSTFLYCQLFFCQLFIFFLSTFIFCQLFLFFLSTFFSVNFLDFLSDIIFKLLHAISITNFFLPKTCSFIAFSAHDHFLIFFHTQLPFATQWLYHLDWLERITNKGYVSECYK